MPTVLDLVGVAGAPGLDGRSLRAVAPGHDPSLLFRGAQRQFDPQLGAAQRDGEGASQADRPADSRALRPGRRSGRAAQPLRGRAATRRATSSRGWIASRSRRQSAAPRSPSIRCGRPVCARSATSSRPSVAAGAQSYTSADDPKQLVHLNAALDDAAAMWARGDIAAGNRHAAPGAQRPARSHRGLRSARDHAAYERTARGGDRRRWTAPRAAAVRIDRCCARSAPCTGCRRLNDRALAILEPLAREDASDCRDAGHTRARHTHAATAAGTPRRRFREALAVVAERRRHLVQSRRAVPDGGSRGDARDALTRAVAINPDLATAHNALGVAYARMGNADRATAEWRLALALRPDSADAPAKPRTELARAERADSGFWNL